MSASLKPPIPDATSVYDLGLEARGLNACVKAAILTVGDIRARGRLEMMRVEGFGSVSLWDVERAIGSWLATGGPEQLFLADIPTHDLVAELARRFPRDQL